MKKAALHNLGCKVNAYEMEAMQMIKACNPHIRFIADHMDAVDHCQTSREILRNQAMYDKVDRNRLSIPEDGETIVLK